MLTGLCLVTGGLYFREHHPKVRIIAMSGGGRYVNYDNLKIAKAFGTVAVLAKPFVRDEMLEIIRQALES